MFRSWKQFKKAWVDALRSGEYRQDRGVLLRENGDEHHFCCLGVAANLLIEAGNDVDAWNKDRYDRWFFGHKRGRLIGTKIPKWLKTKLQSFPDSLYPSTCAESRLIDMNDDGRSFKKIADYIEENL